MQDPETLPVMGVVIVCFNSGDVILDCLETVLASSDVALRIVVVDNGSRDDSVAVVKQWAAGETLYIPPADLPFPLEPALKPVPLDGTGAVHRVTLIETGSNAGFAGGVNRGLAHLAADRSIDRFWVLNPDALVPPATPAVFANAPEGFSLMGGRVIYYEDADKIQIDGGTVRWHLGVTDNINQYEGPATARVPQASGMDFITGASMVASRAFYEAVGPMREDYFLYYEEVDWAQRRGDMPLAYDADAVVYHKSGTSIGSASVGREASVFSLYFKHRARMRFLWRFSKSGLIGGAAYGLAKAAQLLMRGQWLAAVTIVRGSLQLPPSRDISKRL